MDKECDKLSHSFFNKKYANHSVILTTVCIFNTIKKINPFAFFRKIKIFLGIIYKSNLLR